MRSIRAAMKSQPGPPMTLGGAAAAQIRLVVWCKARQHHVKPDPADLAARHGAETPVLDWRERLVCSHCGNRQVDMVISGTARDLDEAARPIERPSAVLDRRALGETIPISR